MYAFNNPSDHYDAIVNISKEGLVSDYLFTEQTEQVNQQNPMGTPDEASSSLLVMESDQLKQSRQDIINVDECDVSRNKSTLPDNIHTGQPGYKKTEIIEISDDSDTEMKEVYNMYAKKVHKRVLFPRYMYMDKEPEVGDSIPHDIDGFKYYLVKTNDDEWNEKAQDRQHFNMGIAPRKGFYGKRKIG